MIIIATLSMKQQRINQPKPTTMPTICPKCDYARKDVDTAPSWQCPSCEVAYSKVGDNGHFGANIGLQSATGYRPQIEQASHTWKWVLVIAVVIGVAWQGKLSSKRVASTAAVGQLAEANGQPTIILYSATWCGYCRAARDFLNKSGMAYTEYDIEKSDTGKAAYNDLGGGGIPIMIVGGETLRGWSQDRLQHMLGQWIKG
jgi:glutaredoxin